MISRFMNSSPTSGSVLSVEPAWDSLSPSLSAPPPLLLSQNKYINLKKTRKRKKAGPRRSQHPPRPWASVSRALLPPQTSALVEGPPVPQAGLPSAPWGLLRRGPVDIAFPWAGSLARGAGPSRSGLQSALWPDGGLPCLLTSQSPGDARGPGKAVSRPADGSGASCSDLEGPWRWCSQVLSAVPPFRTVWPRAVVAQTAV